MTDRYQDYTLGFGQANSYALALIIPITLIYTLPYGVLHGWNVLVHHITIYFTNIPVFIITVVIGIFLHELLHALCWSWLDGITWNNIHFGFKWRTLTPYVHCPDPVEISSYRWGVAMPGMLLGLLPYILALLFQQGWLLGFSLFFTLAAGGDILILWLLRDVNPTLLVQDHPDLVGCRIYNEKKVHNERPLQNQGFCSRSKPE